MNEVGSMQVVEMVEDEHGSTICTFDLDDKTAALAQELGLKLLLYCGATGTNSDYVFRSILGETDE